MRYEARLTAYDLFDQVQVSARVWDSEQGTVAAGEADLTVSTRYAGQGEADPARWLLEALVALAETL